MVAHLTPQEGEELFALLGNMTPSNSTLDRLPQQRSAQWEPQRPQFETTLRTQEDIPAAAVTMAVSLKGVMGPMKDGERQASGNLVGDECNPNHREKRGKERSHQHPRADSHPDTLSR